MRTDLERIRSLVRDVPDFPRPGVGFKDLTPLLADASAFGLVLDWMAEVSEPLNPERVVGIEARGFLFAAPLAARMGLSMVPMRKAGKLPWQVEGESYALEYGSDRVEVHRDAVSPGDRVVLVDDVLATGGTARAGSVLLERLGAKVAGLVFAVELAALGGRARIDDWGVSALLEL